MQWIISGANGRTYVDLDTIISDWEQGAFFWVSHHLRTSEGEGIPMLRYLKKGSSLLRPEDVVYFVNAQYFAGEKTDDKVKSLVDLHGIRLQPPLGENETIKGSI